uniref:Uncharacterized protein n=1 Tax=Arundo donax TaxID=35708 RepID=A0A0A9DBH1_ARUDO
MLFLAEDVLLEYTLIYSSGSKCVTPPLPPELACPQASALGNCFCTTYRSS